MKPTAFAFVAIFVTAERVEAQTPNADQQSKTEQLTADNCTPQPDCRVVFPILRPGASIFSGMLGGNNSIQRELNTNNLFK